MTNFDFLFGEKKFSSFSGAAASAEKIFGIDTAACAVNARRAAELAVKWMYENDSALPDTYRDQLAALTGASEFRALVGNALIRSLDYIRRVGNNAAHNPDSVTKEQAQLSLKNLYDFAVHIAERYSTVRPLAQYDRTLLDPEAELVTEAFDQADIRRLQAENRAMKRMLNALRKQDSEAEEEAPVPAGTALSEADTRRLYIETALAHAGWRVGTDCFAEYPVEDLAAGSGVGYADYALCGEDGVPLAIVETQSADGDIAVGRQQAKLYADALQRRFGRRPVLFLSNGTDTRVWFDESEAERRIGGFYSRRDLLRAEECRRIRRLAAEADLEALPTDRAYQRKAIRAVSDALCVRRERAVLLSMAPGTGKTRTALAAAELLRACGWVQNVLFLSENDLLTVQAYREFSSAFPGWRAALLTDRRAAAESNMLFATFADLMAEADELTDAHGTTLLTAGRFDLVICDETELSLCRRYADVFAAFDAPILALSSAPTDTLEPTLCDILNIAPGSAAFVYSYEDAVRDGFAAACEAHEVRTARLTDGVCRRELSDEARRAYDKLFTSRGEDIPEEIRPAQMLRDYCNTDTVRLALEYLREHGRSRDGRLGKTILFTYSHEHSERIYEQWARVFPADPPHFCRVIDSSVNYARSLAEDFTDPHRLPQAALSHDLLLDGINVPAAENLVFFTRAASRTTFWRMLGRGMRRCADLPDGKPSFFVLDLCGNFRTYESGDPAAEAEPLPVWSRNFAAQARLAQQLQSLRYSESCASLRGTLVRTLHRRIGELDRCSFSVRRRLSVIDRFGTLSAFDALSPRDVTDLTETVAPVILPDGTSEQTALFNEQMYDVLLSRACGQEYGEARTAVLRTVRALSRLGTHKKIAAQKKLLNRILYNKYLDNAPLPELETARRAIEPLIRYLPEEDDAPVCTFFSDHILDISTTQEKH